MQVATEADESLKGVSSVLGVSKTFLGQETAAFPPVCSSKILLKDLI